MVLDFQEFDDLMVNTWGRRTTGNEFFVLCPSAPSNAWLISTWSKSLPHDQQQCEAYSTFSSKLQCPENIVIPLEGVLIVSMSIMISKHLQSGLEFTKLWKKIPTSVLVDAYYASPLRTKENIRTTHYAALYHVSNTLNRTLEYLAIHS